MLRKFSFLLLTGFFILSMKTTQAQQEGFLGEVKMFAGNFPPRGWAFCNGQLIAISQNQALFSILGTAYGGDGRVTFGLPDFRSRLPKGVGTFPGLATVTRGQMQGRELITLSILNLPSHNHLASFTQTAGIATMFAVADDATQDDPTGNYLAIPNITGTNKVYSNASPDAQLANGTATVTGNVAVGLNGGSQAFDNRNPYTGIHFIICIQGAFPTRN